MGMKSENERGGTERKQRNKRMNIGEVDGKKFKKR